MLRGILLTVLTLTMPVFAVGQDAAPIEDFALVHISDVHVSPHLARTGKPDPLHCAESIAWICREATKPQELTPFGITTPTPAFGIATGDLTEYGVIDDTFAVFERAFAPLPYPLYVTPGNHDNTWVAVYQTMRARYGGENYSFDKFGCHFACISSASPQEPVPTIDGKTRAWLQRDLEGIPPGTPVFLALHHPPYGNEFANPAEYDTLIDLLRDYNVVLVLYGHGHGVNHRDMDGIDGVMGGSTFGDNAGYGVVSVQDGVLRVAYHFQMKPARGDRKSDGPGWRKVLEKPIQPRVPNRLFRISMPRPDHLVSAPELEVALEFDTAADASAEVSFFIDGAATELERVANPREARWRIDVSALRPGWHLLTVRVEAADGRCDLRTSTFVADRGPDPTRWRTSFPAAVKAGPVVVDDSLIVARTDGVVCALERRDGGELWSFQAGGEILGTPAWSGEVLVFGSGDGKVYALDASGKETWTFDAGLPVYGPPRIDGETVYIGDNGGRLHALELGTGRLRWTFSRADYSIESRPCVWRDLVVFGAWDGYLYAVRPSNGELAWKVLGPKSSDGKGVRYFAPADCGPVALGDALLVCDRGYILGSYDRAGALGKRLDQGVSAITADPAGQFLYCRTTGDRVCKVDAAGEKVWEAAIPAGRFPVPPTLQGDAVYVCSNGGLVSVLDSGDGSVRWQYQVTPGFYVMAPVAVDERGVCYVAGMNGTVTALRPAR